MDFVSLIMPENLKSCFSRLATVDLQSLGLCHSCSKPLEPVSTCCGLNAVPSPSSYTGILYLMRLLRSRASLSRVSWYLLNLSTGEVEAKEFEDRLGLKKKKKKGLGSLESLVLRSSVSLL